MATPVQASALQNSNVNSNLDFLSLNQSNVGQWWNPKTPDPIIKRVETPKPEVPPSTSPEPAKPEPRKYTVVAGDNLSKIATEQNTTWPRLWNKNAELTNPDLVHIGQVILIPDESEVLADRPVPQTVQASPLSAPVAPRGIVPGNGYVPGNCTWYVKTRRADLPNDLGNANTWYARAQAYGIATGTQPRAGAVGTTTAGYYGHVVYVERVNGDGSILISEMNYAGEFSQRTRTASASEFVYIY